MFMRFVRFFVMLSITQYHRGKGTDKIKILLNSIETSIAIIRELSAEVAMDNWFDVLLLRLIRSKRVSAIVHW